MQYPHSTIPGCPSWMQIWYGFRSLKITDQADSFLEGRVSNLYIYADHHGPIDIGW